MTYNYEKALNNGDFKKAVKEIFQAIEEEPKNVAHYINGGTVLYQIGQVEEANNFLLKAIEIEPNSTVAYYTLGNMYFNEEKYKDARTILLSVYDKMSDNKDINYLLGMTHVHEGNAKMAIPFLEQAYQLDKTDYEYNFQYAVLLCQMGLIDQGEILLQNIVDNIEHADAEYNLGLVKWTKYDDKEAALSHFKQAITIKPDHILAHNGVKHLTEEN